MGGLEKSSRRVRGNSEATVRAAYQMRREMTPAERFLWSALRLNQLDGLGFRRQHPLGPYILDFCCPSIRLVIELDGDSHHGREEDDLAKTTHLESYGYRVIRFQNQEVLTNLPGVLSRIREAAHERTP